MCEIWEDENERDKNEEKIAWKDVWLKEENERKIGKGGLFSDVPWEERSFDEKHRSSSPPLPYVKISFSLFHLFILRIKTY